jgi:hypothetical protein
MVEVGPSTTPEHAEEVGPSSPRAGPASVPAGTADRSRFAEACMVYGQTELARLGEEVQGGEREVAVRAERLRAAVRTLHAARLRRQAMELALERQRHEFEGDYEVLVSLPHVRAVEVEGSCVRVLTDTITIEHEAERYRIGEFALTLDLERGISVTNLANTGTKPAWDHPHVQGGLPCLGNLRDGCEKLLAECQLPPLVSVLIQFLQTYIPATAYCSIQCWETERDLR